MQCIVVMLLVSPGGYTCADEPNQDKDNITELKSTIKQQNATIKQLQDEMKKLQENYDQLSAKHPPPDPVAQALPEHWSNCARRGIKIEDGLAKVTFLGVHYIVWFFVTGAEEHSLIDLTVFLKAANLKEGTIEYYNGERKLFSRTGSLTDSKTKKYY